MYLKEFQLAMETDNNQKVDNKSTNVNRNKEIYDGLRSYLAKISLVRLLYILFKTGEGSIRNIITFLFLN